MNIINPLQFEGLTNYLYSILKRVLDTVLNGESNFWRVIRFSLFPKAINFSLAGLICQKCFKVAAGRNYWDEDRPMISPGIVFHRIHLFSLSFFLSPLFCFWSKSKWSAFKCLESLKIVEPRLIDFLTHRMFHDQEVWILLVVIFKLLLSLLFAFLLSPSLKTMSLNRSLTERSDFAIKRCVAVHHGANLVKCAKN